MGLVLEAIKLQGRLKPESIYHATSRSILWQDNETNNQENETNNQDNETNNEENNKTNHERILGRIWMVLVQYFNSYVI